MSDAGNDRTLHLWSLSEGVEIGKCAREGEYVLGGRWGEEFALDTRSALEILRLLSEAVHGGGQTAIIVTHDPVAASHADRVVFLADGQVVDELHGAPADAIAERMTHLGAWGEPAVTGGHEGAR